MDVHHVAGFVFVDFYVVFEGFVEAKVGDGVFGGEVGSG